MPRTEIIKVIVSAEEKAKAEQLAAAQGLTLSAYLRRWIILEKPPAASAKQTA